MFIFKMCAHYRKAQHKTIFNWSLLVNSDMWIWKAIKFPHYHGLCQKKSRLSGQEFGMLLEKNLYIQLLSE